MNEKKVLGRSVTIALGIICIILVVSLIVAVYQISSLNSKMNDLTDIVYLGKSTVWVNETNINQTANNHTSWLFTPRYAGALIVDVWPQTNSTYVRVLEVGYNYDYQITFGPNVRRELVFPVIPIPPNTYPFPYLEIRVGNTNAVGNATISVSITYRY